MPKKQGAKLVAVPHSKMARTAGLKKLAEPKKFSSKFPVKKLKTAGEVRTKVENWKKAQKAPTLAQPSKVKFTASKITSKDLTSLRMVHESAVGTAEILKQKMRPQDLVSKSFSSIVVFEYMKMRDEYQQKLKAARGVQDKADVKKQWAEHVKAASVVFAKSGARGIKEKDLEAMTRTLVSNKANFQAVTNIYNTGTPSQSIATVDRIAGYGEILASTAQAVMDNDIISTAADLCDNPIQSSISKHFSASFNFNVRIRVWCPTWTNPLRTCVKTFTLAGVSFSMGIDVGYKIDCRGFTAWGTAYAEACATILGLRFCAGCVGQVVAGAALGQSTGTGTCRYGAGATVNISCTFCGLTVFQMTYSIGLLIEAPCVI